MKMPEAIDLHRFFAPEWDLSLGNCEAADVEKRRAVPRARAKMSMADHKAEGAVKEKKREGVDVERPVTAANESQRRGASRQQVRAHDGRF